jgi:hypothetical protein
MMDKNMPQEKLQQKFYKGIVIEKCDFFFKVFC